MSRIEEARYGRACLLVLNVCPFILRHVIDDYSLRTAGSLSLCDFLERNKHTLFHLYARKCCCRNLQPNRSIPMTKTQWDTLFMQNKSCCLKGKQIDCPCKYDCKPSMSTNVMDITLCCVVINNICPGVDINHIRTIREIRNKLIHAESASLDQLTYNGYWNRVETAICQLAKNTSTKLHKDTVDMIKELEKRVMDPVELGELRNLITDKKRFTELEKNVSNIADDLDQRAQEITEISSRLSVTTLKETKISTIVNETQDKVKQIEDDTQREMSNIRKDFARHGQEIKGKLREQLGPLQQKSYEHSRHIDNYGRQINDHDRRIHDNASQTEVHGRRIDYHDKRLDEQTKQIAYIQQNVPYGKVPSRQDGDPGVRKMKERLLEINDEITRVIQLSPLQDTGKGLPLELLYASVVICEDQKYVTTEYDSPHSKTEPAGTSDFDTGSCEHEITSDFDIGSYKHEMSHIKKETTVNRLKTGLRDNIFLPIYDKPKIREVTNPDDIFKKDGKYVRKIYMLGDAAHGKTTYCLWLLRKWCNAKRKERMGQKEFDKWEEELNLYDFVFLIKCRNVDDPNVVSVLDMICHDAFESDKSCHNAIRHVLCSDEYKSLLIIDGLDEWTSNNKSRMPKMDVSDSVTCFISMRPWVFPLLLKKPQYSDRVIEILGLSETGMENVIRNVLINHYKLEINSQKYIGINNKILRYLEDENVKSFMQIPLLAVVCVQIWYEGKQFGDSLTSLYAEMLNMLIERAIEKHEIKLDKTDDCQLPIFFSRHYNIESFGSVLLKLGKVAYEGLLSNETKLVFQKRKLEKEIGVKELQLALDVGLISQKEAHSLTTRNVSVHFFHYSVQEFLAAIHIVANKEVGESLCQHFSNVKDIMNLSNVIMFICGMCPSLAVDISKHVVMVTDSDTNICQHRKSPRKHKNTVKELYEIQLGWYRELHYGQTDNPVTFHISDVYLEDDSHIETVRRTREILCNDHVQIRSLWLYNIPTDEECRITDTVLNNFLYDKRRTKSLVMFCVSVPFRLRNPTCIPTLKSRCLFKKDLI